MIDLGTAVIISSLISMLGFFLWSERNNINWFKKENFKLNIQAEKLKLKKLAKELNLDIKNKSNDKGLIESIKDLDMDKIKDLLSYVQKGDEYEDLDEDNLDFGTIINKVLKDNPELIKKLPELLGKGNKEKEYIT